MSLVHWRLHIGIKKQYFYIKNTNFVRNKMARLGRASS